MSRATAPLHAVSEQAEDFKMRRRLLVEQLEFVFTFGIRPLLTFPGSCNTSGSIAIQQSAGQSVTVRAQPTGSPGAQNNMGSVSRETAIPGRRPQRGWFN